MSRTNDGNEPHFVPHAVDRQGPSIVVPGEPQHVYSPYKLDEVCETGIDIRVIGRVIMGVLITHFSDEQNIRYPSVRPYLWDEDPQRSKIRIALNTRWDAAQAGKSPTLIVSRGQMQMQELSIGGFRSLDGGNRVQGEMVDISYTVGVYCQADGLHEYLTSEVLYALTAQFALLRRHLPFHKLRTTGVTGVEPAQDKGDHWLKSVVGCGASFEYIWQECEGLRDDTEYCVGVSARQPTL